MQEFKRLVRLFFAFLMRPIKRLFRAMPLLQRAVQALFRVFPRLKMVYERLMPPQVSLSDIEVALVSEDVVPNQVKISFPRKRPLTTHAAIIFNDLKTAVHQNKTCVDTSSYKEASSPKELL